MELVANRIELHQKQLTKEKSYAISDLIDQYHDRMYWFVRKLLFNHDDAQDVLQNTWMRAHKNLNSFKGNSAIHTWLFRIAYNESMRFIEKNKSKYESFDTHESSYVNRLESDVYFDGDEFQRTFHRILSKLTEEDRNLFQFKYFDELKFSEIAEITKSNQNTIKSKYYKIVTFVEEELKKVV